MSFQLVPKSVTLNEFERCDNYSQVADVHLFGLSWAIIIAENCNLPIPAVYNSKTKGNIPLTLTLPYPNQNTHSILQSRC